MSVRRTGLPIAVKMRHNAHYVEEIISRSGAAIGRMIPVEDLQPNADQPRKDRGEMRGLIESRRVSLDQYRVSYCKHIAVASYPF